MAKDFVRFQIAVTVELMATTSAEALKIAEDRLLAGHANRTQDEADAVITKVEITRAKPSR